MDARLNNLQIGRFIAAACVVAVHLTYGLYANFGFSSDVVVHLGGFGVSLFFVISGFIISHIEIKYKNNSSGFLIQRIARITPLYYTATLAVLFIIIINPSLVSSAEARLDHLIKSLLFIPFSRDGEMKPMLFLGWTLNYEMYFYLLAFLSLKFTGTVLNTAYPIVAIVAIDLIFKIDHLIFDFYANPIVMQFLFGMALSIIYRKYGDKLASMSYPLLIGGLILLFISNWSLIQIPDVLKTGLSAAMFAGGILGLNIKKNGFTTPFIFLGDASYSMYIIHPYIIQLSTKLILPMLGATMISATIHISVSIILIIIFSVLSYLYFEKPSGVLVSQRLTHWFGRQETSRSIS